MIKIYEKYGFYEEKTISVTLEGIDGLEEIQRIMNNFRNNPPRKFGEFDVIKVKDYKTSETMNLQTGESKKLDLPESNVLYYELSNKAWCCIRPSGTEPKIKYYIGVKGKSFKDSAEQIKKLEEAIKNI